MKIERELMPLIERKEPLSCSQIIQTGLALASLGTVVGFGITNYKGCIDNVVSRSLLEVAGGIALQGIIQGVLSKKWCNLEKSFIADYATPIFLILSQVYDNLSVTTKGATKHGFFGFFNVYGGMTLSAYLHSALTRRLGEGFETVALHEKSFKKRLRVFGLDTTTKRIALAALEVIVGASGIVIGSFYKEALLARDFGVILTGYGLAQAMSEIWYRSALSSYQNPDFLPQFLGDTSQYSSFVINYIKINRMMKIFFHALPGALIVGAGELSQQGSTIGAISLYVLTGLVAGLTDHLQTTRFTEVPPSQLTEFSRRQNESRSCLNLSFKTVKWFIGVPSLLAFIGLGIAGLNASTGKFERIDPFDQAALASFGVFLYGGYLVAEVAQRAFSQTKDSKLINTAYFFTHYCQSIALPALYIMEKMEINDKAITKSSSLTGIMATIAYASLGFAIGTEANSRFDTSHPRVASSLYFALFGKYFVNLLTGKLKS